MVLRKAFLFRSQMHVGARGVYDPRAFPPVLLTFVFLLHLSPHSLFLLGVLKRRWDPIPPNSRFFLKKKKKPPQSSPSGASSKRARATRFSLSGRTCRGSLSLEDHSACSKSFKNWSQNRSKSLVFLSLV